MQYLLAVMYTDTLSEMHLLDHSDLKGSDKIRFTATFPTGETPCAGYTRLSILISRGLLTTCIKLCFTFVGDSLPTVIWACPSEAARSIWLAACGLEDGKCKVEYALSAKQDKGNSQRSKPDKRGGTLRRYCRLLSPRKTRIDNGSAMDSRRRKGVREPIRLHRLHVDLVPLQLIKPDQRKTGTVVGLASSLYSD